MTNAQKNQMTTSQICAIFLAVLPLTKVITAPSIIAESCKEKLWQPVLLLFLIDILFVFLFLKVMEKHQGQTFYQVIASNLGNVFAKVIFLVYVIYFLLKAFLPIIEHKELIDKVLYEQLPRSTIFYPAFLVVFFMCLKGLKSYARGAELCFFLSSVGLLLIIFLSATSGDYNYLLPIFQGTTLKTPKCLYKSILWFNDGIYLIVFMGHFNFKKHSKTKIISCYFVAMIIITAFYVMFYSIFRDIAPTQKIALSAVSIFSVSLVNVGRFDYIAIFLLALSQVFAIALPLISATKFLKELLNCKNSLFPAMIVTLTAFVFTLIFATKYFEIVDIFVKYTLPFFWFAGYILPFLAVINVRRKQIA